MLTTPDGQGVVIIGGYNQKYKNLVVTLRQYRAKWYGKYETRNDLNLYLLGINKSLKIGRQYPVAFYGLTIPGKCCKLF